jgi:hypothetical protein
MPAITANNITATIIINVVLFKLLPALLILEKILVESSPIGKP